jgi:hypothetical protein
MHDDKDRMINKGENGHCMGDKPAKSQLFSDLLPGWAPDLDLGPMLLVVGHFSVVSRDTHIEIVDNSRSFGLSKVKNPSQRGHCPWRDILRSASRKQEEKIKPMGFSAWKAPVTC